jgi:two-component system CheB/CheR fusion protein
MLAALPGTAELRAWVAGCATGEEAYSLAIVVHETLAQLGRKLDVKIFATDVHAASLERAALGEYPPESLEGMDGPRRERYFRPGGLGYRVIPGVRQMVVFATHNLLRDPPFPSLDLITCRNLLIYLKPAAQRKVISLLHFGLEPRGVLLLGPSEGTAGLQNELEVVESHFKVFRKRREAQMPPRPSCSCRRPIAHGLPGKRQIPRCACP